jgi:hypothetical protein
MGAITVLRAARAAGIKLERDLYELVVAADAPPPASLLNRLRRHKDELLEFLQPAAGGFSRADWLSFHDERVAEALATWAPTREDAELAAFDDCVEKWLLINRPAPNPPGNCISCGGEVEDARLVGTKLTAEVPLHEHCAGGWYARRRADARAALHWLLDAKTPSQRQDGGEWTADDWHAFYDERAAIAEFDGGMSKEDAECAAYEACVNEWMRRHPVQSQQGACLACKGGERGHDPILPFANSDSEHVWLHQSCWPNWFEDRRRLAAEGLAECGIHQPVDFLNQPRKGMRDVAS